MERSSYTYYQRLANPAWRHFSFARIISYLPERPKYFRCKMDKLRAVACDNGLYLCHTTLAVHAAQKSRKSFVLVISLSHFWLYHRCDNVERTYKPVYFRWRSNGDRWLISRAKKESRDITIIKLSVSHTRRNKFL